MQNRERRIEDQVPPSLLERLFIHPTNSLLLQLARYTLAGSLAFITDFGLLYILTEYENCHYLISAGVSFTTGLIVIYFLSSSWVFKSNKVKTSTQQLSDFSLFALIGVIGVILNEIIIAFLTEEIGVYYLISKLITAVFIYLFNFFIRKYTIYR